MLKKVALLTTSTCLLIGTSSMAVFADTLWNDTSTATLYTDRRPTFVIGGLITVMVSEKITSNIAATNLSQKQIRNQHQWQFPQGFVSGGQQLTGQLQIQNQLQANMQGTSTRNGQLILNISSRIEDILPNGNLIITGRKQIRVNDEISEITVTGIIRQNDVTADNTITSAKVSDMKLNVHGTGPVSAKITGGLFSRLFNWMM